MRRTDVEDEDYEYMTRSTRNPVGTNVRCIACTLLPAASFGTSLLQNPLEFAIAGAKY